MMLARRRTECVHPRMTMSDSAYPLYIPLAFALVHICIYIYLSPQQTRSRALIPKTAHARDADQQVSGAHTYRATHDRPKHCPGNGDGFGYLIIIIYPIVSAYFVLRMREFAAATDLRIL